MLLLYVYFTHEGNEVKLWSCTPDCREQGTVIVTIVPMLYYIGHYFLSINFMFSLKDGIIFVVI